MIKKNLRLSETVAQFDRSPTHPVAKGYRSQRAEILKRFPLDKWPEMRLSETVAQFDRSPTHPVAKGYRSQRAEILKRFPLDKWPEMRLEDYALGQPGVEDTYCRLEYKSRWVGGIGGGAARKHIIYKRKDRAGWYFPNVFSDEREAWERLRSEFVQAFELAKRGEWERIDELETLSFGPAVKLKSLHVYFPAEVLPVYSTAHLRRFLRLLDRPPEEVSASSVVALNRFLLEALRRRPGLEDWNTEELQRLLYIWRDPRETSRVLKIAPGENARFWDDCLREGYICVGWDEVGDLSQFESREAFRAQFEEAYPYNGHLAQARRKGNELWKLAELEPGDLVVANRGIGHVLALGEVVQPGYRWADDRREYRHTVAVEWNTTYKQNVAPQKRWATVTVAKVPDTLLNTIVGGRDRKPIVVEPVYGRIAAALERKRQLILYGPPGTGKTYQARRFAVWWLLKQFGRKGADTVLGDSDRLREAERELSTAQVSSRVWWIVANPKEWSWDRLFPNGKVEYRYGRLKRNYPLVQRGDLVVGYQSTPDKRVMALARVTRELQSVGDNPPTIELEAVEQLDQGLSYDDLTQDAVLAESEPMRFNNQGTLFALTETEAEYLLGQLAERHPQRAILKQADSGTTASVGPLTRVTFHPSYTYEDFIEGFRPNTGGAGGLSLALEDGVFKRVCRAAQANPGRPYLLLIDEINRGNVAKIMGELLTLLESDKRGLTLTLPQSKETFSVPPNVSLLGTMNTADRSIKLLDAALRRRFAFIECMPDSELLHGAAVGELALDDFLDGLNERIARFEGREKQVGHSYLLVDGQPVDEVEEFAARFREEILPLLQEYCYDDYAMLAKFIGSDLVDAGAGTLNTEKVDDDEQLVATLAQEFGERGGSPA